MLRRAPITRGVIPRAVSRAIRIPDVHVSRLGVCTRYRSGCDEEEPATIRTERRIEIRVVILGKRNGNSLLPCAIPELRPHDGIGFPLRRVPSEIGLLHVFCERQSKLVPG